MSLTGSHKTSRFSQAIVESLCRRCSSRCSQLAGDDVWDNCCCCCCCCLVFDDRSAAGTERWSLIWQTMPTNKSSTRWLSTAETLMNLHARRLHSSLASVSATTTDSNKVQSPCTARHWSTAGRQSAGNIVDRSNCQSHCCRHRFM